MTAKIVLVTNSAYSFICDTFIELKNKNWRNCPYEMIVTYCGSKEMDISCDNIIYNGENVSLPTCIYNVLLSENDDYFICFLGDAFIYKKIDNEIIKQLMAYVERENIDYLRLFPVNYNEENVISKNHMIRKMSHKDRGISFVAFVASRRFIVNEFSNGITDYDFEMKFLKLSYVTFKPREWNRYIIYTVINNVMNIYPGIDKGRWDRSAYKLIKKYNKEITLPQLTKVPLVVDVIRKVSYRILRFVPTKYTKHIKKFLKKFHIYQFASDE